jgi:hypothetical protein
VTSTLSAIARFYGEWNCSQSLSPMNVLIASLSSFPLILPDADPLMIIDTLVSLRKRDRGDDRGS